MSEKVISSKFKTDIDRMIEQGQSSRKISTWLSKRGESISHVTISSYRNNHSKDKNTILSIKYESTTEAKNKLVEVILQKATECHNNPVKLRNYIDTYLKLSNQIEMDKEKRKDLAGNKFDNLTKEELTLIIKDNILKVIYIFHPLYRNKSNPSIELEKDYKKWSKEVIDYMGPIFEGKLPCSTIENVKC